VPLTRVAGSHAEHQKPEVSKKKRQDVVFS